MRVIAGKFRGHQLVGFNAPHIRPTTDRVKETIFNILMAEIDESRFLDLFSGTGSLGIEALSRGAQSVHFVESSGKSLSILEQNLKKLKITGGVTVIRKDVFTFLKNYQGEPFNIVIADPPFTERIAHKVAEAASQSCALGADTLFLIESSSHERMDDRYGNWVRYRVKDFGDKILSCFHFEAEKENQEEDFE